MADPLVRLPPGPPCPQCGCTESLEALRKLRKALHQEREERNRRHTMPVPPQMSGGGGAGGAGGGRGGGAISFVVGGNPPSLGKGGQIKISAGSGGAGGHGAPPQPPPAPNLALGRAYGPGKAGGILEDDEEELDATWITDRLTCVKCGTWFARDPAAAAEQIREQIRKLKIELDGAIGCLADLAGDST